MVEEQLFPALFIGHGSPSNALLKNGKYFKALRTFADSHPKPSSIVVLSAHWQTEDIIEITGNEELIPFLTEETDNGELIKLLKPFKGNPSLARSIAYALKKKGIRAKINNEYGLDYGAWGPASLLYPENDVPIIQLSLPMAKSPKTLLRFGLSLKVFRKEDILFIGSGNIVYNEKIRHQQQDAQISGWAIDFDTWIEENMFGELDNLLDYENQAPNANYAVPTPDHFNPIFFVLGLKGVDEKIKTIYEGFEFSTTSMRSFKIMSV